MKNYWHNEVWYENNECLLLTDRESVCQEVACNDIESSLDWGTFQF